MPALPESQTTDTVLMVRPARFGWNPETAESNQFQKPPDGGASAADAAAIARDALAEFDGLVKLLRANHLRVLVAEDCEHPAKPDAVFPNNWFSVHARGAEGAPGHVLVLYPLQAQSRRPERRPDLVADLRERFDLRGTVDLSSFESEGAFLEGTGSLILDRPRRIAYAARSSRTHARPLAAFASRLGYRVVAFQTRDPRGVPAYHTNVVLSLGERTAVVCLDAIEGADRDTVAAELRAGRRTLVELSCEQMDRFAANVLELRSGRGEHFWVMSAAAHDALTGAQRDVLTRDARLLVAPLPTIERYGGGSARCMLAEIFTR